MLSAHRHDGYFVLRTPLRPFASVERALTENDRERADELLRAALSDAAFSEALWLGSPSTHEAATKWLNGTLSSSNVDRLRRTLLRYLIRAGSRAMPFGLWAGVSVGPIGSRTDVRIEDMSGYRRNVRFDASFLDAVAARLHEESGNPSLRLNTSAYRRADKYYFVYRRRAGRVFENELTSIVVTPYVELAARAARRTVRASGLVEALAACDSEVPRDALSSFIADLASVQFLVPALGPVQTGTEPEQLLEAWCRTESTDLCARFLTARSQVRRLNELPLGLTRGDYAEAIEPLQSVVGHEPARVLQVDLWKPGSPIISEEIVQRVARVFDILRRIGAQPEDPLAGFRRRFVERYGDAAVPLTEALDEEVGIPVEDTHTLRGYPEPLLKDFKPADRDEETRFNRKDRFLLDSLQDLWSQGAMEWRLTDKDIGQLASTDPLPVPVGFSALIRLMWQETVGDPPFEFSSAAGPPNTRLTARFAHLSPELATYLRGDRSPQQSATLFAEVVHVPENRLGNVMFRPTNAELELPYLAASSADPGRQISVDELVVSVAGDQVHLRSARNGVRIIPVINHAVAFWRKSHLPLFRFLGALQQQLSVSWSWGALRDARFLPRVVVDGCIVSRAAWQIRWSHLGDDQSVGGLRALLRHCRVPPAFAFREGDQLGEMSATSDLMLEELLHLLRTRGEIGIVESLANRQAVAGGPGDLFVNECIIPFTGTEDRGAAMDVAPAPEVFVSGSRWITAKIYSGPAEIDRVIREDLARMLEELAAEVCNYHFVRYADPEHHIRIRLESDHPDPVRHAVDRLFSAVMRERRASRVVYDSYRPETWRYGGPEAIHLVEHLFTCDSDAVRAALQLGSGIDRWLVALLSMESWIATFDLSLPERSAFTQRSRDSLMHEFGITKKGEINASVSRDLIRRGEDAVRGSVALTDVPGLFDRRHIKSQAVVSRLSGLADQRKLTRSLTDILWSLIHMSVNRIVRTRAREQEACLYHVLSRHYAAMIGRGQAL